MSLTTHNRRAGASRKRALSMRSAIRLGVVLSTVIAMMVGGFGTARAEEFEAPQIYSPWGTNPSTAPNCVTVYWRLELGGSGVNHFTVFRQGLTEPEVIHNSGRRDHQMCGLQPDTTYRFKVCAHYITEDGPVECGEEADLRTAKAGIGELVPQPQVPKPAPRIVQHNAGANWIDFRWETSSAFEYDHYIIFYWPRGDRNHVVRPHRDDGAWGYDKISGLKPSTTYDVQIQGCITDPVPFTNDDCYGKSEPYAITTPAYPLHSGPDTCAPPFVWREAFADDKVCVDVKRRAHVKGDNAQESQRRVSSCSTGPGPINCRFVPVEDCKHPWVWREARPTDKVCVTWQERDLIRKENATAHERRAAPVMQPVPGGKRIGKRTSGSPQPPALPK